MLRVREEQADEARRLIAESRDGAGETGEEDISGESASEA
jgi:hypothetical protein